MPPSDAATGSSPRAGVSGRPHRPRRVRVLLVGAGAAVGIGLLGVALSVALGAGGAPPKGTTADARPTLDTGEAALMDFDITTTATGEIGAAKQLEIRSPLERDTTITEIVAEGTAVRAGDVLVRLNDDALRTQLDEESLQLETARAQVVEADEGFKIQLSENESGLRQAKLKLDIARLELDQWKEGTDKSRKQQLDHALERAEKDEERLREKYKQAEGLYEKGYCSKDQLKQDELAHEKSEADLEKARLEKAVYYEYEYPKEKQKRESDVDQAAAELERVERQNKSRQASKEAELNNRRRSLEIREDKYAKCKKQVDSAVLKAPQDGLVVYASSIQNSRWSWNNEGPPQVGSKVYPNQELIVLPDTSAMIATVRIHESLASIIKPGQTATVKVDALGGERFTGRVESIGILAEQTNRWMDPNLREYTVKIALELPEPDEITAPEPEPKSVATKTDAAAEPAKPEATSTDASGATPPSAAKAKPTHKLKPSMRCEAEVLIEQVKQALAVPIQAVFNEGPLRYVHVAAGSRYVRRPVLVGRRSDRYTEIKAGIEAAERVLVRKPAPAEVIARPWDAKELAAVGLTTNDQGQIVSAGPPGGGEGRAGGRPGGNGNGGKAKPKVAESTPTAQGKPAGVGS